MIEPYVRADGTVYQPEVTPEQVRALRAAPAPSRRKRNLGKEFAERARLARERREAEGDKQ